MTKVLNQFLSAPNFNICYSLLKSREADFEHISGTKMRALARDRKDPPKGFMAPKAWQVLAQYYQEHHINGDSSSKI